jgi:hypothetical protein
MTTFTKDQQFKVVEPDCMLIEDKYRAGDTFIVKELVGDKMARDEDYIFISKEFIDKGWLEEIPNGG